MQTRSAFQLSADARSVAAPAGERKTGVDVNLRYDTQRKVTVVNNTHPPGFNTGEARRRRFVVMCPACRDESHQTAAISPRTPETCSLCSGLRRVPRLIAERYTLSRGDLAA